MRPVPTAWETRCCTTPWCGTIWWLVSAQADADGLWWVSAEVSAAGYLVAGTRPLCPYCGEVVQTRWEVENAPSVTDLEFNNPLVTFVTRLRVSA